MRDALVIAVGRVVRRLARARKPGGGSAIPGLVVNRLAPGFLFRALRRFPQGLVVVTGSSGKSTTTKMLVAVLEAHGVSVFTNPSTANISQGLTSALLERSNLRGRIASELAVLEMDEGHAAKIAPRLSPRLVLVTNVMTDQIDRFEDSEKVARLLGAIASRATEALVTNADDGYAHNIALQVSPDVTVVEFGVQPQVLAALPRGLGYAQQRERYAGDEPLVQVCATEGRRAVLTVAGVEFPVELPAIGTHYAVDAAAAIAAAAILLGDQFDADLGTRTIGTVPAVFGRGEVVTINGEEVEFVLVQNPASFQLNVDALDAPLEQVLVAMGSDVRDPSYFWPVDCSRLSRVTTASGSKAAEIALQLSYQGVTVEEVEPNLNQALDKFLALPAPAVGRKTIIFTADAMRRTRSHLGLSR